MARLAAHNTLAETTVRSLSQEGCGLARIDGRTVFIDGGLPGERVQFFYARQRARYDEGRVVRVLEPAPARVTPPCPHFGICGGCSLQHLAPEQQLQHKASHGVGATATYRRHST